jgi:hypothetical protein
MCSILSVPDQPAKSANPPKPLIYKPNRRVYPTSAAGFCGRVCILCETG